MGQEVRVACCRGVDRSPGVSLMSHGVSLMAGRTALLLSGSASPSVVCSRGDELLSAVDVVCRAGERRVGLMWTASAPTGGPTTRSGESPAAPGGAPRAGLPAAM